MNKSFSILLLSLGLFVQGSGCSSISKKEEDSLEYKIDHLLKRYNNHQNPGLTVAILDHGEFIFRKGYGMANLEKQIPNTPETIFNIASMSKQFTAALIHELVRENKITLQNDIRIYIPEFPDYGTSIKVSDLLYHTSGVRDYMVLMWLSGISFESPFSNENALQLILKQKELNFPPGERFLYSNSNYVLLAEIIKRVTDQPIQSVAQERIFDPLGMNNTRFGTESFSEDSLQAQSYTTSNSGYVPFKNNNKTFGDGGIRTTVDDLKKWDLEFYKKGSVISELQRPGTLKNGMELSYGSGVILEFYRNEPIQNHPGAFLGYRSEMLRFPNREISIICLSNTSEVNPEAIAKQIADIYVFKENLSKEDESAIKYEMNLIDDILGKYEVAPNVFIDIRFENNQLNGQVTGQTKQRLIPIADKLFEVQSTKDKVSFDLNDSGKVIALTVFQKEGKTVAKKLELVSDYLEEFVGSYYNSEQDITYVFFLDGNKLKFKAGQNPPVVAKIIKGYEHLTFDYQSLEYASIKFIRSDIGKVIGFSLSSGRVSDIEFTKI